MGRHFALKLPSLLCVGARVNDAFKIELLNKGKKRGLKILIAPSRCIASPTTLCVPTDEVDATLGAGAFVLERYSGSTVCARSQTSEEIGVARTFATRTANFPL